MYIFLFPVESPKNAQYERKTPVMHKLVVLAALKVIMKLVALRYIYLNDVNSV